MDKIPLTDLKLQYDGIKDEMDFAIKKVINETNFILGPEVKTFEEEIAKYFGVKFAVGVASGTDALVLSLLALGIGQGDEVITTPFTFIATAEAISRVGAKPVFCDIEYETFNIDPNKIRVSVTKKTKAILPVHLYGLPCELKKITAVAAEFNLRVIEDCAQSFGSEYEGKKVGSVGDCGCLSFFPAKTLGCYGDGGMVIVNDEAVAERLKMLRNHGSAAKYFCSLHGFNSRLDTLHAAILRVKLRYIDNWITKRINNAFLYNKNLTDISNISVPMIPGNVKHSFNYYTIRIKKVRNALQEALKKDGIASAVYYPLSLHMQEVYNDLGYKAGDFPISEEAQQEVLSLPMYPEMMPETIQKITDIVKGAL